MWNTDWLMNGDVLLMITASSLLLSLFLALIVVSLSLRVRRYRDGTKQQIAALKSDVHALCSGAVGVGRRLARMEMHLNQQDERQDKLEMRESNDQAYGHAVRMVQKGADIDELVETCRLSRGEAELILLLHRSEITQH